MLRIVFTFFLSVSAFSEIYNCNGVWVNKPCSEEVLYKFTEIDRPQRAPEAITQEQKKIIIQDLEILKFQTERDYKIPVVISEAKLLCEDTTTSLADCSKLASQKIAEINQATVLLKSANLNKTEKTSGGTKNLEDQQINITVIENTDYGFANDFNNLKITKDDKLLSNFNNHSQSKYEKSHLESKLPEEHKKIKKVKGIKGKVLGIR